MGYENLGGLQINRMKSTKLNEKIGKEFLTTRVWKMCKQKLLNGMNFMTFINSRTVSLVGNVIRFQ